MCVVTMYCCTLRVYSGVKHCLLKKKNYYYILLFYKKKKTCSNLTSERYGRAVCTREAEQRAVRK